MNDNGHGVFRVLGNGKRIKIVDLLFNQTNLSVEEVSRKTGVSYKSTSKHLRILEGVGLVKRR
ncbi:MAG: ArsR family transcriptional regulator [Candidatus Omnitrophota bacterium]